MVIKPLTEPTRLGAAELARRIAEGEWTASEVVEAHIRRIEQVNPTLNALVAPLFGEARAQARDADEARGRGEPLGPLHGVPVTIKEMYDVAGTPTTAGIPARAGHRAGEDSPMVAKFRRAGAIVLGKTNVPQMGMMYETDNPVYGQSYNPWDRARSPGGSSGGEAALIAAGGSPLGLGSDGGGSIRHPCHCCGIHGFKPTGGRLPLRGHWMTANWREEWCQPGPMARHVADLTLALNVLSAPEGPAPGADPEGVTFSELRVGTYEEDGFFPAAPAIRRAVREAAAALGDRGLRVTAFRPPEILEGVRLYLSLFYADGLLEMKACLAGCKPDWRIRRSFLLAGLPAALRPALGRLFAWTGQHFSAQMLAWLPKPVLTPQEYDDLLRQAVRYRERYLAALDAENLDILLSPANGLPALRHGAFYGSIAGSYGFLYNLLGFPAGVVAATRVRPGEESDRAKAWDPVNRTARAVEAGSAGLPVGVQVVARPGRDLEALAVMAALEEHFRGQADYPAVPV